MMGIKPAFEKNNVPVCFFSDDYYVPYLGTAVYSAVKNAAAETNLDILIFENGYTLENKKRLKNLGKNKKNVSIRFIDMVPFIKKLSVNPNRRVSVNCFAKIFCTDSMFRNYERIIALDSDLLVLDDLMKLYKSDMKGRMFAAVRDEYIAIMHKAGYHTDQRLDYILLSDYFSKIGLDVNNYFNSGVILFDIQKCRMENIQDKIIEINNKYPSLMYAAQDDLNILFQNRWAELEEKWNVQNPYSLSGHINMFPQHYLKLMKRASILHFLGKSKPWEDENVWEAKLYDSYAFMTPWKKEYLKRRRKFKKINSVKMLMLPKGSRRRDILLKVYFKLLEKKRRRSCFSAARRNSKNKYHHSGI